MNQYLSDWQRPKVRVKEGAPPSKSYFHYGRASRTERNRYDAHLIGSKTLTDWQPSLADLRVLVVDDEPDARELIAAVLMGPGAEVVSVESAGEALEEMERQRFDVLVSDIGMPLMDGYERIPAAAQTTYAGVEDRMRALSAGFSTFRGVHSTELRTRPKKHLCA